MALGLEKKVSREVNSMQFHMGLPFEENIDFHLNDMSSVNQIAHKWKVWRSNPIRGRP